MPRQSKERPGPTPLPSLWIAAAHDLRQPIQSLTLLVDALAGTGDAARRRDLADLMESLLANLQSMVDRLAELGRLEAGIRVPRPEPVYPARLLEELRDGLAGLPATARISLGLVASKAPVKCDRALVARLLRDLAIAAAPQAGTHRLVVAVRRRPPGLVIEVVFLDRGITPAQGAQSRDAVFVELPPVAGVPGSGTAAGLALVERFTTALGGRLEHVQRHASLHALRVLLPLGEDA